MAAGNCQVRAGLLGLPPLGWHNGQNEGFRTVMSLILAVAAGGALGEVGRYMLIARFGRWLGTDFPAGTIVVNAVGSFLLGVLIALMAHAWSPSPELRVFLTAGALGALTTFSTFAMDVAYLTHRRAHLGAVAYVLASVGLSLGGFFSGLTLALSLQAVAWRALP